MERNRELLEQYGLNPDEFLSETPPEVAQVESFMQSVCIGIFIRQQVTLVDEIDFVGQEEERTGKERKERQAGQCRGNSTSSGEGDP